MKKLLVVLFVFSIVGGYVFGNPDSAQLQINGTVDSVFLVDFVSVDGGTDTDIVSAVSPDLINTDGSLISDIHLAYTWERANATYKVDFSSLVLDHVETDASIAYEITHNSDGAITDGAWNAVEMTNGQYTADDGETLPLTGTYSGELTATISAN